MAKKTLIVLFIVLAISVLVLFFFNKKAAAQQSVYNIPPVTPPQPLGSNSSGPASTNTAVSSNNQLPAGKFPLKKGSTGKAVQFLQVLVGVKPDGIWGNNTEAAILSKLGDNNITTGDFLMLVSAKAGAGTWPLTKGMRGPYVSALQIMYGLPIDGTFGTGTENAVKKHLGQTKVTIDDFQRLVISMLNS